MSKKNVLVVGGAGYIGSYVAKLLYKAGWNPIVFDNLSRGKREAVVFGTFIKGDMANLSDLEKVFSENKIDAVMHFAAFKDVGESVAHPDRYYQNNLVNTLNLLNTMIRHGVLNFIFSSSAAIFGIPKESKVKEETPCHPINPYGTTKWMVEEILKDYDRAFGLKSSSLRYFNAAGADPDGEVVFVESNPSNLIPIVLKSLQPPYQTITIFGEDYDTKDGTCVRDYIHIHDLGTAHLLSLNKLLENRQSCVYNLGNGQGFTVKEVIEAASKVTGKKVQARVGPRRAGDPPILLADSTKAKKELLWQPIYPELDTILSHAWNIIK